MLPYIIVTAIEDQNSGNGKNQFSAEAQNGKWLGKVEINGVPMKIRGLKYLVPTASTSINPLKN